RTMLGVLRSGDPDRQGKDAVRAPSAVSPLPAAGGGRGRRGAGRVRPG
ncbi:hypothetical protein, partial [Streptomyces albus]